MIRKIVDWIDDYITEAGIDTMVVGVSGGIDSAVVTRLCELVAARQERRSVCCVAMPMYLHDNSDPTALDRAMELCVGRPKIDFHIRQIGSIVEAYKLSGIASSSVLRSWEVQSHLFLREGNLRSRIRANILYDFAADLGGIVIGTGNLDEDEIGYFTKGGDGLVDLCPLSKIHKSDVKAMGVELCVPESILKVPPTAGLWDGQTDEGELGMKYDEIAWAIDFDNGADRKFPGLDIRSVEVLNEVRVMRKRNAHKLKYPPVFDPNGV